MSKELSTIQQNIASTLESDAVFTPADPTKKIDVLTQRLGDLESEIASKVASLGISAVVITPLAKLPRPEVSSLELNAPLIVQITEDATLNQTGYSALDLACEVMCLLHNSPTGLGDPRTNYLRLTETPLTLVDESPTYHVNFVARVALTPRRAQPATQPPPNT